MTLYFEPLWTMNFIPLFFSIPEGKTNCRTWTALKCYNLLHGVKFWRWKYKSAKLREHINAHLMLGVNLPKGERRYVHRGKRDLVQDYRNQAFCWGAIDGISWGIMGYRDWMGLRILRVCETLRKEGRKELIFLTPKKIFLVFISRVKMTGDSVLILLYEPEKRNGTKWWEIWKKKSLSHNQGLHHKNLLWIY